MKMLESATRKFSERLRDIECLELVSQSGTVSGKAASEYENAEGGGLFGRGASFVLRFLESLRPRA